MTETTPEQTEGEQGDERSQATLPMSVSVEKLSDIERKVAVEIPWEQVKGRLDEAYRELGQGVSIKGFRKGKVPRKMLERLFGKHVNKEVSQRLVQESIAQALGDNDIAPVSEPQVQDEGIVNDSPFAYSATLQVVPEIEPKDYFEVEVKQRPPQVTDEQLQRALEAKRQEQTEYQPVEGRSTQAGDVVLVDVLGKIGDRPVSHDNLMVELGGGQDPLPGLAEKLTGIAPEEQELDVQLEVPVHDHGPEEPCPDDEKRESARLLVTVKDVKKKVVPELGDEFAKDTGEAETLEQLRQVIRDKLLADDERRARDEAKNRLVKELLKRNEVPLVPALVERHLERMYQLQMALLGMDPSNPPMDEHALKERSRADAEEAVRSALLLEAVAKKEKVEAQEADLEKKLAEIAAQRGQNVARVRGEYEKEGRLSGLKSAIREEKTLDLLMTKAILQVVENPDDLDSEQAAAGETTAAESAGEAADPSTSSGGEKRSE